MIKTTLAAALALLVLGACRHPQPQVQQPKPDYNGVNQRADGAYQDLDSSKK